MKRVILCLLLLAAILLSMTIVVAPASVAASGNASYSSIREYYASNPQPGLSNQSLVFDYQSGRVTKIVTGKPGEASVRPAAGATIVPNVRPD